MPIMCVVQLPQGKKSEQIQAAMQDLSNVLMKDFEAQPNQGAALPLKNCPVVAISQAVLWITRCRTSIVQMITLKITQTER